MKVIDIAGLDPATFSRGLAARVHRLVVFAGSASRIDRAAGLGGRAGDISRGYRCAGIAVLTLARICRACGVSLQWLALGHGKPPSLRRVQRALRRAESTVPVPLTRPHKPKVRL